jgi:hypothetical protein
MSFAVSPQTVRASAPGVANDVSQGFVIGSMWVDTTPSPDALYICTSNAAGAAVWVNAGGVTAHPSLSTLGWSASGHTGTTNAVACFSNTGAALTAQATVDGTVLTYSGGVLQFLAMAATIAFLDSRTLEIQYAAAGADVVPAATALVVTGAFV